MNRGLREHDAAGVPTSQRLGIGMLRPGGHLYLRLREQIASLILSDCCGDGEQLPSVRALATGTGSSPLTVAKAYKEFLESGVIAMRRGVGLFVVDGGCAKLRVIEKARFLGEMWPSLQQEMKRLQLDPGELVEKALTIDTNSG